MFRRQHSQTESLARKNCRSARAGCICSRRTISTLQNRPTVESGRIQREILRHPINPIGFESGCSLTTDRRKVGMGLPDAGGIRSKSHCQSGLTSPALLNRALEHRQRSFVTTRYQILICYASTLALELGVRQIVQHRASCIPLPKTLLSKV